MSDALMTARALILHDLHARDLDAAPAVNVLESILSDRKWWLEEWPDGAEFLAGQVAQDVQDEMLDGGLGRWPRCTVCDQTKLHELRIEPDLGPDPHWVCEESGIRVAPLGQL